MILQNLRSATAIAAISPPTGGFHPMLRGPIVPRAPDAETGSAEPLSIEDGIALLSDGDDATDDGLLAAADDDNSDGDADGDDAEAAADDEDEAPDQEPGDEDAPDDEPASEDDAEDEDAEPEAPAIAAPEFWSAEEKATFAKAPAEVQQLVATKVAEAEKRVYSAKEEAAAARKDASVIGEFKAVIDQQVERAQTIFQGKWDGVDWAQWAKDDVGEYAAAKEEFEAEQREIQRLQTVQAATADEDYRQFTIAEKAKLADPKLGVPELIDPVKGKENKTALVASLRERGFSPEDIKWAGAKELQIAWEALQYRLIKARASTKPAPKPEPVKEAKAKALKPAAATAPRKSIAARDRQNAVARVMQSGRMDDAVAALMAMEG